MVLTFGDLLCLWVLLTGTNSYIYVLTEINNHVDIISFNSRLGFQIVCIGMPLLHLFTAVEYFWPFFLKKYNKIISQCVVVLIVGLLVTGIFGSYWIQARVEKAGYVYCRNASGVSALAKTLVYTKNMDICEDLVETTRKQRNR